MTYQQGSLIEASDYNQIREDVGEVYNDRNGGIFPYITSSSSFGYGVPHESSTVALGESISATDWNNLFTEIYRCATHQGVSTGIVPEPDHALFSGSGVQEGDIIEAYDGADGLLNLVSDIRDNRLNFGSGFYSITSGGSMLTDNRTTPWSDTIEHEFEVSFSNIDNVRYFFNSGGQIIMSAARTGGSSNTQNTDWTNGLNEMEEVKFEAMTTTTTGIGGNTFSVGLYDLTTSNQLIYQKEIVEGDIYYGGNDSVEIYARLHSNFENNATLVFTFRCIPNNTQFDGNTIDGTLTNWVDKREADTYVPPPESLESNMLSTTTSLSVGG